MNWLDEDVVTDIAEVDASGWALLVCDKGPDGVRVLDPVPASEPFADAAELGAPPARTELREYIEDTDIRFVSTASADGFGRSAGSGRTP